MRKLFLSLLLFFASVSVLPSFAQTALQSDPRISDQVGPAAGHTYFGYTWPFGKTDLDAEIGDAPVLVELFSDAGCVYCPAADQFFNDLVRKTRVIALACPVNILNTVPENPFLHQDCADRYSFYSVLLMVRKETPHFFINGKYSETGLVFQQIRDKILSSKDALSYRYVSATQTEKKGNKRHYQIKLPAVPVGELAEFDDRLYAKLIEYRAPVTSHILSGPNAGLKAEHLRLVKRIVPLGEWFGDETVFEFSWTPDPESEGAVIVFERQDIGLVILSEIMR